MTDDSATQLWPAIYGDRGRLAGNLDIFMFDLSTWTETALTNDPADQGRPAITANWVAWEDRRSGDPEIMLLQLDRITAKP